MARILVIEDNPTNMRLTLALLRSAGHTVTSATDAEVGLTLARSEKTDLILMDIQLPGMDGLAATALLKQDAATCAIPVVALSALAMKGDEERIRAAGCDGYIAKPLVYQDFLATVAAHLETVPATGESPLPWTGPQAEETGWTAPASGWNHRLAPSSDHNPRALILIVDDERHNRQVLQVMLAPEGYSFMTAASGDEALQLLLKQPPDLILADVMMPGMNGYQLSASVKNNPATKHIPVILVTALSDHDARMQGLDAGAEEFLTKPVDRGELCLRVRNLLNLKSHGDHHAKYSQMLEGEVTARSAELVESERLYRETFDAAPVGILHTGLDGEWLRVNHRLCEMLGYTREELQSSKGRHLVELERANGEEDAIRQITEGRRDRYVVDEKRFLRRDGNFMWGRVNISMYSDSRDKSRHLVSVIENITESRALEAQVRQTSKMDAVGQLASGVAHDFNNLLQVIALGAEMMALDPSLGEQNREDLGEIIKAARRGNDLTKQLLAFGRQQVLLTAPIDVNGLIRDVAGMLDRLIGDHVQVVMELTPDLPSAFSDRGQLEQVVMNLVVNARDAMPSGGRITIRTYEIHLSDAGFGHERTVEGNYVVLAVTDCGTGMSKETKERIFEPFFTTKDLGKGTGLGLSTTYGIVKQSKGYISVDSELGAGTTFKVFLPRAGVEVVADPIPSAEEEPIADGSETILLVEDESALRRLSKRALERAGYHVLVAEDGNEAERLFVANADSIAMVVSDVNMPGCGGPELVGRLHARTPALRVLFMSGNTAHSPTSEIPPGLNVIQKPFATAELIRQVRRTMDQ